jgi:hypothetical protein
MRLPRIPLQWENPVLTREMLGRMRNHRTFLLLAAYTTVLSLVMYVAYVLVGSHGAGSPGDLSARVSRALWLSVCSLEAFVLPLVVPALTCGTISVEREKDMLDLLLLTRETPARICIGKLFGGVGLAFLLLLSSLPVLGICFVLGGVSPGEMAGTIGVLFSTILLFGCMGLATSSLCRKTSLSLIVSYAVSGISVFGLPIAIYLVIWQNVASHDSPDIAIFSLLLLIIFLSFGPALLIGCSIQGYRLRRGAVIQTRAPWILSIGLSWAGLLLFLYLPSVSELFLNVVFESSVLLYFHPAGSVMTGMGVSPTDAVGFLQGFRGFPTLDPKFVQQIPWWTTSLYTLLAGWFFLVALVRVQRFRMA